jgi:hypothetical protein
MLRYCQVLPDHIISNSLTWKIQSMWLKMLTVTKCVPCNSLKLSFKSSVELLWEFFFKGALLVDQYG